MPMSVFYYVCDAMAVWIIVQAVTGKIVYRRVTGYRRENPRAFWCFLGIQTLVVAPLICSQFHLRAVGMVVSLVMMALVLGVMLYGLGWLILHPRMIWRELRARHAEDPQEFWRGLFFGNSG